MDYKEIVKYILHKA